MNDNVVNLEETELRLGLPGSPNKYISGAKRGFSDVTDKCALSINEGSVLEEKKAQVVGWPPIRSFRKKTLATNNVSKKIDKGKSRLFVKVSMDGAPYLRKVDLNTYFNYVQLSSALEKMFACFTLGLEKCTSQGSKYVVTYQDKDGDCMLVGDVPWEMFMDSCKRLRIMKSTDTSGLAPHRSMHKCKNQDKSCL